MYITTENRISISVSLFGTCGRNQVEVMYVRKFENNAREKGKMPIRMDKRRGSGAMKTEEIWK